MYQTKGQKNRGRFLLFFCIPALAIEFITARVRVLQYLYEFTSLCEFGSET